MTMTASDIDRDAPTRHAALLAWVREVAELTTPDRVVWCDGSPQEWRRLTGELVDAGTLVPLDPSDASRTRSGPAPIRRTWPGSRSAPSSARSTRPTPGPTNNWMDPAEMKAS